MTHAEQTRLLREALTQSRDALQALADKAESVMGDHKARIIDARQAVSAANKALVATR